MTILYRNGWEAAYSGKEKDSAKHFQKKKKRNNLGALLL